MANDIGFANRLRRRLAVLYGPRGAFVADQVIRLMEEYAPRLGPRKKRSWDERDIILITYPDQVRSAGCPALESLANFLALSGLHGLVNILHILPFYPWSSDDGFAVSDFRRVHPDYGDWAHIRALAEQYDLMVDLVLNHVSKENQYFKRYLAGEEPYQRFFIEATPGPYLGQVVRPRSTPLLTQVKTSRGPRYVWTTFSDDQIDLNYAEPQVLLEMLDILLLLVANGARIIRLDAIAYLWKRPGTPCIHLPETHEIVKLFRDVVDAVAPGTLLLTETNVPHEENISYFGDGDEAHMVYQFSLAPLLLEAFLSGDATPMKKWLTIASRTPPGTTVLNFTASHDGIGVRGLENLIPSERLEALCQAVRERGGQISMRLAGSGREVPYELNITYYSALGDQTCQNCPDHVRRFLVSQAFMVALRGIPGIYFLSLFGTPNDLEGLAKTGRARSINRRKFLREELDAWLADGKSVRSQIFEAWKKLLAVRRDQEAFHPEAVQHLVPCDDPGVVAFERRSLSGEQKILVLFNVAAKETQVPVAKLCGRTAKRDLLASGGLGWLNPPVFNQEGCALDPPPDPCPLGPQSIAWLELSR